MSVLYHLTILPPRMPEAEALSQEIGALRAHFGGNVVFLNPNVSSPVYVPRLLFGFHKLRQIRTQEADLALHHLYNPDPFPFLVVRWLKRPVIYSLTSGLGDKRLNKGYFSSLAAITVYDERSLERLRSSGFRNGYLVQPGIDTTRFSHAPVALGATLKLMVGSAPWTRAQFVSKGIDSLLEVAKQLPHLRLVFLWRDILFDEMQRRLTKIGLEEQVQVLNRQVDVNEVLSGVHASITLAADSSIIKAYPHSLLDSLAAGKPVIVSRTIPMSDYVDRTGCGKVAESLKAADIVDAIEALTNDYRNAQRAAMRAGQRDFKQQTMVASYANVYEQVLGAMGS